MGLAPYLLARRNPHSLPLGPARWAGTPLVVAGAALLLSCIWEFARRGRGTLAPVDAPKFVVRSGPYRWVRNPMYVGNLLTVAGEALIFRSVAVLGWWVVLAIAFNLFVLLYEEPTLARRFGADYEAYRRSVPRWVPRPPAP